MLPSDRKADQVCHLEGQPAPTRPRSFRTLAEHRGTPHQCEPAPAAPLTHGPPPPLPISRERIFRHWGAGVCPRRQAGDQKARLFSPRSAAQAGAVPAHLPSFPSRCSVAIRRREPAKAPQVSTDCSCQLEKFFPSGLFAWCTRLPSELETRPKAPSLTPQALLTAAQPFLLHCTPSDRPITEYRP